MPIAKIQLPDGRVARFEVPDGTTPEQVTAFAEQQFAPQPKATEAPKPELSTLEGIKQGAGNLAKGIASGFADVGDTIINAVGKLAEGNLPAKELERFRVAGAPRETYSNAERTAGLQQFNDAHKDSTAFTVGRIGGNVAATVPVGGVLGAGAKALGASPAIVSSLATGGMRAGAAPGLANMATRIAGGAATGTAAAGLINPDEAWKGGVIGAALPPTLAAVGNAAKYAGRAAGSVVKPFTASGQQEIAGNVIRKFADGGPTTVNARQLVPGSTPTLAEATGNPGLATLQRGVRDLRPNAFIEREAQNAAARLSVFDDIAGDANAIAAARAARDSAASPLYDAAKRARVASDSELLKILDRPSAQKAWERAQKLALEKGEKLVVGKDIPEQVSFVGGKTEKVAGAHGHSKTVQLPGLLDAAGNPITTVNPAQNAQYSGKGLHYLKMGIDDLIGDASSGIGKNEKAAILGTKEKLMSWLDKNIPEYGKASAAYAEKSAPINAMETLQGLKLTDAQGNITLAKVQNAIRNLSQRQNSSGIDAAKSVTKDQMDALIAIRDDLLRQSNLGLGRSIGSNTFQNIATDNILNSMAGNGLSRLAERTGVTGALGQVGRLAYSGPNEAIRNRLVDMMLDPQLAEPFITGGLLGAPQAQNRLIGLLSNPAVEAVYRSAPALAVSR